MIALLDVNMLVALMDRKHALHGRARAWWQAESGGGWASCSMTQNGFLRIITLTKYPNRLHLADAIVSLRKAVDGPKHHFWPDDLSILDATQIDHSRLLGPRQITDIHLLALAVKYGGRFVTMDGNINPAAVKGATRQSMVLA